MTIFTSKEESHRLAIELRKKGYSYSEIVDAISIPKSTVAKALKNIKLTDLQIERLKQKRILGSRRGGQKLSEVVTSRINEIETKSKKEITKISKKELWLMGLMLYYKERGTKGLKVDMIKGVSFASSDPLLISFFMRWLKEVGKLNEQDILCDIFILDSEKENAPQIKLGWARILKLPISCLSRIYVFRKSGRKKISTAITTNGFLKIRVRASSMLARQISGWIKGIATNLHIPLIS